MTYRRHPCIRPLQRALVAAAMLATPWQVIADGDLDGIEARLSRNEYNAAAIELKNHLLDDPADNTARLLLGEIYLRQGRGEEAKKELETAMASGADPVRAGRGLAEALLLQRKLDEAHERLAELPQDDPEVLALQGRVSLARGDNQTARSLFARAAELAPAMPWPALGLALTSDEDPQVIAASLDAVIERFPDFGRARLVRAELHNGAGEHEQALGQLTALLANDPENLVARRARAQALITLDRFDDAADDLQRVERGASGASDTPYLRAVIAYQSGAWQEAIEHVEAFLVTAPRHSNALAMAGLARLQLGQPQTAAEYLGRAVAAQPGNLLARRGLMRAYLAMNDPRRAAEALAPLAEHAPIEDLLALSRAFIASGNSSAARDWAMRADAVGGPQAEVQTQLLLVESQLAAGETGPAIARLRQFDEAGAAGNRAQVLLAEALLADGQPQEALRVAEAFARRARGNEAALSVHARMLAKTGGDLRLAREEVDRALSVAPDYVPALFTAAEIASRSDDHALADGYYQRVLENEPSNRTALLALAASAERQNDIAGMDRWLTRAATAYPEDIEIEILRTKFAVARGDVDAAVALAEDLLERFPNNRAALENRVRAALLTGHLEGADAAMEALLERFPDEPPVHLLAGNLGLAAGNHRAAVEQFREAVRLEPRLQIARIGLVNALAELDDIDAALTEARAIQTDYPDLAAGFELEGSLLLRRFRYAEAVQPLQQALARNRSRPTLMQLAEAYQEADQADAAITVLEEWIQQHQDDVDALVGLGWAYELAGKPSEAIGAYRRASRTDTPNPLMLNNLALLLLARGHATAAQIARRAYEMLPENASITDTYGWILTQQGDLDQGLTLLLAAYLKTPDDPEVGYHAAYALQAAGRGAEAVRILRELLRRHPEHDDAETWTALLQRLQG